MSRLGNKYLLDIKTGGMGISVENWRGQLGRWERRRGGNSPHRAKGISGLLQILQWNNVGRNLFILIVALLHAVKSLQSKLLRRMTTSQVELAVVLLVLCLSARISEVAANLMHDLETNPGPCMNQVT